jgi:hypothetical protein
VISLTFFSHHSVDVLDSFEITGNADRIALVIEDFVLPYCPLLLQHERASP